MLESVSEPELKSKFNTELNMHKMFIDGILDVMKYSLYRVTVNDG
jgi:hypothetical protein